MTGRLVPRPTTRYLAELAGPPFGECVFAQYSGPQGVSIVIERADPHILLAEELVAGVIAYPDQPWAHVDTDAEGRRYLRITASNRTVVYRLGAFRAELNAWEAAWPD